jgi:alpha-L-fucosidase
MKSVSAMRDDHPVRDSLPTDRQLAWQEMDQYVLVHFTPTTFENKEWGYGDADPAIFNPSQFDASQIAQAAKDGEFKGLILVAKHHDGFCLWPTKTTPYNISRSPWRAGKGDMVKEFSDACRKAGLKFGVYCSPWDRNHPEYGRPSYVATYREQLRELYTGYGELFMSWHDGANGGDGYYGGAKETRTIDRGTYYGWDLTWALTRQLQPNAVIFSDIGPDVRWVGNEHGEAAFNSWATFTPKPVGGKASFGPGEIEYDNSPTGTKGGAAWIPAECDVPHRPGWFYHPEQDSKVKTPEQLFDLYLKSVGRGACLNLGLAPDTRGILHENDVASLRGFGELVRSRFAVNLAASAREILVDGKHQRGAPLLDKGRYSELEGKVFEVQFASALPVKYVRFRENIKLGHRIESWAVSALVDGAWVEVSAGESVGACRIVALPEGMKASSVRVVISGPGLSDLGVF